MKTNQIKVFNDSIDIIENRIINSNSITNEEIASILGYEQHYFARIFQKYSGMTIQQYVKKRKMSHALIDILKNEKSILDIAEKYLYSADGFTKAFKDIFGANPEKIRKSKNELNNSVDISNNFTNKITIPDYSEFIDEPKDYKIIDGEEMKFICISDFESQNDYDLIAHIFDLCRKGVLFDINYFENGKLFLPDCYYAYYCTPFYHGVKESEKIIIPARKWLVLSTDGIERSITLSALSTYARYEWISKHNEYAIDDGYEIGFENENDLYSCDTEDIHNYELWLPIKKKG